jgi:hypothetical protein
MSRGGEEARRLPVPVRVPVPPVLAAYAIDRKIM